MRGGGGGGGGGGGWAKARTKASNSEGGHSTINIVGGIDGIQGRTAMTTSPLGIDESTREGGDGMQGVDRQKGLSPPPPMR